MIRRGPKHSDLTDAYWQAAAEKQLMVQTCNSCQTAIHYARHLCPQCLSDNLDWQPSSGQGTVYSFTVVHRHPNPVFNERVPAIVALIDLDDGIRVMSVIVNADQESVSIGAKVKVAWEEDTEGGFMPVYELAAC